jgi:hypothetical protein
VRIALIVLLVVHGLIHLIGVGKAGPIAGVSPAMRGLWLAACAALLISAALVALRIPSAWLVAGSSLLLSQALIFTAWPAAKAGTLVNLVLGVAVASAWADARFSRETVAIVRGLFAAAAGESSIVTPQEVAALPAPVRRWLEVSGAVGKPRVRYVRLVQRGGMRTAPEQDFMPVHAEQYFTTTPPGFVWQVHARMFRVLPIAGRDSYMSGHGRMLITGAALVPFVNASGDKIDQGTLLRYLAEIIWFPSAALSPYLHWEAVDANTARVTMTFQSVSASADFSFNGEGRVSGMLAQRYMGDGSSARLERWGGTLSAWKRFHGIDVPVQGVVSWKLESGDFSYYRWEITDLDYDRPELYPATAHR